MLQYGELRWAVLTAGRAWLLRGGEFGVTKRSNAFLPDRGLHWGEAAVQWLTALATGFTHPSVWPMVCPIKDTYGRHVRHPVPTAEVRDLISGQADAACAYTAMSKLWVRRAQGLSAEVASVTPMFCISPGLPVCTKDIERMADEACAALGWPAEEVSGAAMLRIGGATDMRDELGLERGAELIRTRGRWDSDVAFVYQRVTAAEQLEAAQAATRAERPEAEVVLKGWAQPAGNGKRKQ